MREQHFFCLKKKQNQKGCRKDDHAHTVKCVHYGNWLYTYECLYVRVYVTHLVFKAPKHTYAL